MNAMTMTFQEKLDQKLLALAAVNQATNAILADPKILNQYYVGYLKTLDERDELVRSIWRIKLVWAS
jgi:hypothetical protein